MKILWVLAHPEPRSLSASLKDAGLEALAEAGHETRVSDLYEMKWDPVVDAADTRGTASAPGVESPPRTDRLLVGAEQERAYAGGRLSADILGEQEKIRWADALVLHFPLWWLGPPAILKGWFDRVFVQGFAFGLRDDAGRARRYGDGGLAGKRALLITSVGARESSFGPRGVHGHIDEVLFPLLHGTFFYTGMAALPPYVIYGADRLTESQYQACAGELRARLRDLPYTESLPYRHEAGGDYDDELVLRPSVAPGRTDLGAHLADETGGSR